MNKIIVGVQKQTGIITARGGEQGDAIVSQLHGRHYEQNVRGKIFTAATQALVTTTVGLATTYTGLVVSNPIASVVNLEILRASLMQSVIQSVQIEAFALATGNHASTEVTHTTPVAVKSALIGSGNTGTGLADVAATLPAAPFYDTFLANTGTATANSTGPMLFNIDGDIILKPGAFVCFVTPAQASVAGMWFGLKWAEIPILA